MYKKSLLMLTIFIIIFFVISSRATIDTKKETFLDGYIVFAPLASGTSYMINENGEIEHSWSSTYLPGLSVYHLPDDSIYRTILKPGGMGGQGGGVQKISSDGTILWEFIYDNDTVCHHHDIEPLPNGNVLLLAYEAKILSETIEAGRNPQYTWDQLLVEHIIEVQPTGPTTGNIVWEWHVWDHLIQDFDESRDNYGMIYNHPELIDINYVSTIGYDWLHANSIDYNERLDQILLSIRNFNEIWVIDHSTTTEQSSGHSGGMYGKGGDLLYRWGNPEAYNRGTSSNRKFFWQHDAHWIKDGYPGSGNILIFNNGVGRGYSSVDEIIPPIDSLGNYILNTGEPYGPDTYIWRYTSNPLNDFYAFHLSGEQRLPNGNTLILQGEKGEFFVVTPNKEIVWIYNYFIPPPVGVIFKPFFVPNFPPSNPDLDTEGSLQWNQIKPGDIIIGSFQVRNIGCGTVNWTINNSIPWGNWTIYPSCGCNNQSNVTTVMVRLLVPDDENSDFEGYIKVQNVNNSMDFELVPVILKTEMTVVKFIQTHYENLGMIYSCCTGLKT